MLIIILYVLSRCSTKYQTANSLLISIRSNVIEYQSNENNMMSSDSMLLQHSILIPNTFQRMEAVRHK